MHPILQYFRPRLSSTTLLLTSCALSIMIALFAVFPTVRTEAKPKIGKLPPEVIANYKIRATDGRTYTLGELRGKVVVLDFFAIWCGHSRHHIPSMTEFG